MLKKMMASVFMVSVAATSAFAQGNVSQGSSMKMQDSKGFDFNQFVMKGFSLGLDYSRLDADIKVVIKNNATGSKYGASVSTDEAASAAGISFGYSHLLRGKAGFISGVTLTKKLEDNAKTSVSSLRASTELIQLRPELNVALALNNGIYGAVGGNISILKIDSDEIEKLGFGLQTQIGYVPIRNLGMDIGYYLSQHTYKNISTGNTGYEIDRTASYVRFTQLRARVSYLF